MKGKSNSKARRPNKSKKKSPPTTTEEEDEDFQFAVARVAVSQICQSVGYKSAKSSALETLTSVAIKFIESLAKYSSAIAASANRTESNIFDIAAALRAFRAGPALSAASAAHRRRCALNSPDLIEIADFTASVAETPFAKPVPRGNDRNPDSIARAKLALPPPPHVPSWLPEIPEMAAAVSRRGGEKLWGNINSGDVTDSEEENKKKEVAVVCRELKLGLGKKRQTVRFKFGYGKHKTWNVGMSDEYNLKLVKENAEYKSG